MLLLLRNFVSANLLRILAGLLAAVSVMAILFGARQAGRSAEKADELVRQVKLTRQAREIEDNNRRTLANGDAAIELRKHWWRQPGK